MAEAETDMHIVIVGGGSAGWLMAGMLAAAHGADGSRGVRVTLVESPDVKSIGVGEGTWPTMRTTLKQIGISERQFLARCHASFKQGTRFVNWRDGSDQDSYYHPFSVPAGYPRSPLLEQLAVAGAHGHGTSFAHAVTPQAAICDGNLAPKQRETPEYAFVANYGYHLDAGGFAELLCEHSVDALNVHHIRDHVVAVNGSPDDDIRSLQLAERGELPGDLFIDCSGFAALLMGRHYGIDYVDCGHMLFNDSALALQVPYAEPTGPIASQTISTAREAGWIWDIGLTNRRGIGYTYSSRHVSDEDARATLATYVACSGNPDQANMEARKLNFRPGHRERFWHRNCIAIGMASGFIEPLEASALVMVELAGRALCETLPRQPQTMRIAAERYNALFLYRWERILEFLKLHYVLSRRSEPYWQENREPASLPRQLMDNLTLWREHPPTPRDFPQIDEVFSAASHQYILAGMGFPMQPAQPKAQPRDRSQEKLLREVAERSHQLCQHLPGNRELLEEIVTMEQAKHQTPARASAS